MFCPDCGSENPDDARFCGGCGQAFGKLENRVVGESQEPMRVVDLNDTQELVPTGLKYGVLVASLFMPLIGIVMGLFYLFKGASEDKMAVGRLWLYVGIGLAFVYFLLGSEEF